MLQITEELLGSRIPTSDEAFQGLAYDRISGGLDDGGEVRAYRLHALPLGDVTDKSGECGWFLRADTGDGQFDREFLPVRAQGAQFQSPTQRGAFAGRQVMGQPAPMLVAHGQRDD